ncbi:unnamed protein product [Nippostrongylus brasiliensis]|uniref:DDE_3 domain-containing protein n=1 Tax=Nippostrongylus brasiliensis TaxID=27835 RepID=A0A0N4Y729_NIPBR|nr:unnamed protein product [Nippostrongylus brasiliensis]
MIILAVFQAMNEFVAIEGASQAEKYILSSTSVCNFSTIADANSLGTHDQKHLVPWIQSHFGDRPYVFQQDSAPAHKAKSVQKWCKDNLHDFVSAEEWPPYSPDLNPMDYSIWSVLEAKACATPHRSLDCLKESLIKAWDEIDEDYLRRTIDAFPQRLHQCIVNGGDRVEQI